MNPPVTPAPATSLALGDIYYIIFRHKWKILICTLAGIGAAFAVFKLQPPPFQSDAKLFIRYVLSEKQISAMGGDENSKSPDQRGETIMNSEMEILTSADLAKQVAESIGPEKILAKVNGGKDVNMAAALIRRNIFVEVPPRSSVVRITFKYPDAEVAQPILRELIARYMKMHREVHQSAGIVGDFLTQETDQLRARLSQTEDDLRKAKGKAGIISSLEDTKKTYTEQIGAIRLQIFNTQAELAERTSALQELARQGAVSRGEVTVSTQDPTPNPASAPSQTTTSTPAPTSAQAAPSNQPAPKAQAVVSSAPPAPTKATSAPAPADSTAAQTIPSEKIDEYRSLSAQSEYLTKTEADLMLQFTPESTRVKEIHAQLLAAQEKKHQIETEYPQFGRSRQVAAPAPGQSSEKTTDFATAAAAIASSQAKIKVLNSQLEQLTSEVSKISEMDVSLSELRRRKELEEVNYKHFSESLEQSRLDEALGNGRVSNISIIEEPTPPSVDFSKTYKNMAGVAAAGLGIALAWAFAIELYLDRNIKRPIDIERNFRMPMFLCMPELKALRTRERAKILAKGKLPELAPPKGQDAAASPASTALAAVGDISPLRVYHETLRDRLIGYFESVNLTHKPKLIAVTSVGRNAGVTSTAVGLSQSLSEIGEGNVLLVDMTAGQGSAQQFLKGKAVSDFDDLFADRDDAHVQENLYVVAADSHSDQLSRNMPQRFTKLVPKLKASDFDYIIFDLPPVSQISITPRLASFMDMVLLVMESEKTDRDVVHRATRLLSQSKAHVGAVLNKTRSYGPSRLNQEFLYGV